MHNKNRQEESTLASFTSFESFSPAKKKKKFVFQTYSRRTDEESVPSTTQQILSRYIPKELSMIHYWIGLFLSSFLSLFFAADAVLHCKGMYQDDDQDNNRRSRSLEEGYYEYNDDSEEEEELDIQAKCIQVLKNKILFPTVSGMLLSGTVISFLIRLNGSKHLKEPLNKAKIRMTGRNQSAMQNPIQNAESLEQREQKRQAPLLGFAGFLSSIAWGRGIFAMMLNEPWRCRGNDCNDQDDLEYVFRQSTVDEIPSLGAVNSMGEVGSNANLFYFSWISFILSVSLCYGFTCSPFVHNHNSLDVTSNKKLSMHSYRVRMGTWISSTICCLVVTFVSTRINYVQSYSNCYHDGIRRHHYFFNSYISALVCRTRRRCFAHGSLGGTGSFITAVSVIWDCRLVCNRVRGSSTISWCAILRNYGNLPNFSSYFYWLY